MYLMYIFVNPKEKNIFKADYSDDEPIIEFSRVDSNEKSGIFRLPRTSEQKNLWLLIYEEDGEAQSYHL